MREIRELGEAMIIIDQHPSRISISALGNLSTKFALTLSLNQDIYAVSNAMLLDKKQQRYLAMLTLGQCICRSDRFTQPVLLSIPDFPIKKGLVTDEDIRSRMEVYLRDSRQNSPPLPETGSICSIQNKETLSPLGRIMLENIAMKPLSGVVRRFKELGIKVSPGYKIIEELVSLKLVTPITIDGQKLYDLTAEGRNALGKILPQSGRGGLEHRYFVERIREHYLQNEGFASVEKDDIDLVIETYGKRMAIQVETGKSDIQANLTKLGRYKADLKYMLTTNPEAEVRVKKALQELLIPDRDEIKVRSVKDFLGSPPTL